MWKWEIKDGRACYARQSGVVGRGAYRGEGQPDEAANCTWVPLTLYICPSARSRPTLSVSTCAPFIFVVWADFMKIVFRCFSFLFLASETLGCSHHFEKFLFFWQGSLPSEDEQKSHCFLFYCSNSVSELLYQPVPSVKWMSSSCRASLVLWNKRKKCNIPAKKQNIKCCLENNSVFWGVFVARLSPWAPLAF